MSLSGGPLQSTPFGRDRHPVTRQPECGTDYIHAGLKAYPRHENDVGTMPLSRRHHIGEAQSCSPCVSIVSIYPLSSKAVFKITYNPAVSNSAVVDLFIHIHSGRKSMYKNQVLPVSKEIERILGAPCQGKRELAC
jgi:hypothetical protein